MGKVDFIGIGVQKAATTWLFNCLEQHPEIRSAVRANNKELNFFNHSFWWGYAWYHSLFQFGPWKTGEYSVSYFADKNVPERIYRYNPSVKLVVSLRNPIDRAYSQHQHEVRRRRLPKALHGFWNAMEQNPTYIDQGLYASHLERYLQFFNPNQIHVVLFDDVCLQPEMVLRKLFLFLEVDPEFQPSLVGKKANVARQYQSLWFQHLMRATSEKARKVFGESVVKAAKATKLAAGLRKANEAAFDEGAVLPLTQQERECLQDIFASENERVGALIGRNLSGWG